MRFAFTIILFSIFLSCESNSLKFPKEKFEPVDPATIAYVDLNYSGDTSYRVRLSYQDQKRLTGILNDAEGAGMYKFVATHSINIKFRDSAERSFRVHDNLLKEKGDFTFQVKMNSLEDLFREYQQVFAVKTGEKFKIFFTTNSCCPYCWSNEDQVSHIKFVSRGRAYNYGKPDCEGCDIKAYIELQALSPGTDTIFDGLVNPRANCDSRLKQKAHYIVHVK